MLSFLFYYRHVERYKYYNILAPSECENYYTFDQDDRNENSDETGWFCDSSDKHTSKDWQGEGWYRFTGKSGELLAVVWVPTI